MEEGGAAHPFEEVSVMVREPVYAGSWYPGNPDDMRKMLDGFMAEAPVDPGRAVGIIAPHAGWLYSGKVAGAVYGCVEFPSEVIVLSPNHTGMGSEKAVWPVGEWKIPGGSLSVDMELADLVREEAGLDSDTFAHAREHSLEIQLPFIAHRNPAASIVPVTLGRIDWPQIERIGRGIARAVNRHGRDVMLVASTDMSHHVPAERAEKLDRMAIEKMEAFDPKGLWQTVRKHGITMCGVIPTAVAMVAARDLGATGVKLVRYAHSGHVTGDVREVVGYAGLVIG